MRSNNPSLDPDRMLRNIDANGLENSNMTIGGAVNKTFLLTAVVISTALISVNGMLNHTFSETWIMPAAIVGLVIALITIFNPKISPITAPLYAIAEGVVLGMISYIFNLKFPGIAYQAIGATFLCLLAMLFCYKTKLIQATETFKSTVITATFAIFVLYLVNWIASSISFLSFLQIPMINDNSILGIGFSVIVCIVAALNLIIDFDQIQNASLNNLPKYFEWYCGFSLLITLVWLYIEILRLLSKVRSR